jgi:NitT/TauT family transport system permease protein
VTKARAWRFGLGILGLCLVVLTWGSVAHRYTPDQFPGPGDVFAAWREIGADGSLGNHLKVSLLRFSCAYLLALVTALPLGFALGWWSHGLDLFDPVIQILRPISPIAWFPLAVLWFGVGNAPAIFIIALAAFFPILLSTVSAVRTVPPVYLRVAQNYGAGRLLLLRSVLLPAAFPTIVVGLRIAMGAAWIHLVAGEMLGAQSGLGFLIVDARNFLRTDLIVAGMLTVGSLGLAIDRLVAWAEHRVKQAWGLG